MTDDRAALLQELERLLLPDGTPPEELDQRLAERLGVPEQYVQRHRDIRDPRDAASPDTRVLANAGVPLSLLRAAAVADRIGQLGQRDLPHVNRGQARATRVRPPLGLDPRRGPPTA